MVVGKPLAKPTMCAADFCGSLVKEG
jgi:hypothetical protein